MEENEDEPEDVRQATPVEEEIRRGEIDEPSSHPTKPFETTRKSRHYENDTKTIKVGKHIL